MEGSEQFLIFLLSAIAVLLFISGIYLLVTNRKSRLNQVIYGEKPHIDIRFPTSLKGAPRYIILAVLFFFGAWYLIDGILWGVIFAAVGLSMPLLTKGNRRKKQIRQMEKQLEVVLYQGTNVLRGGGGLYQFMEYLASDKTPEPLHEVFHAAFAYVKELGIPPIDALKKAAQVYPELTDLGMMATTLEEAQKNGADMAEVVEMFASDVRNRRLLQQEIESKTAQGVFTSNFLLGIGVGVPALLQLFGKISDNPTIAGGSNLLIQVMSACCYMMMIVGYLVIRRMAQI